MVESAAYHHKKAVSAALMGLFGGHCLVDPVDHVDSTMGKGLMNPSAEFNATIG